MHPQAVKLTRDKYIELAQQVLRPVKCDWENCSLVLNSWSTLRQHQYLHCRKRQQEQTSFYCGIFRCSGRHHGSLETLFDHVKLSHLSRISLLCPIKCCQSSEEFTRMPSLVDHLETSHSDLLDEVVLLSEVIKPLSIPFQHTTTRAPRILDYSVQCSSNSIITPPTTGRKRASPTSSQATSQGITRKWSQLKQADADEENPEVDIPFDDLRPLKRQKLTPIDGSRPSKLQKLTPVDDFGPSERQKLMSIDDSDVRMRANVPNTPQLSEPLPYLTKRPVLKPDPPESMGYRMFSLRVAELERGGILAGNGFWPDGDAMPSGTTSLNSTPE